MGESTTGVKRAKRHLNLEPAVLEACAEEVFFS